MAKMINVDELIEFCNTERAMLHAHNNSVACAALRRVVEFAKEYAVEAEPIYENPEKGNPESEAYCYDCIHNEVCRWCPHDGCDFKEKAEPVKHGRWETWGYIFHGIAWKRCSVCGKTADISYQALLDGKIEMATPSICGCCSARMDGEL